VACGSDVSEEVRGQGEPGNQRTGGGPVSTITKIELVAAPIPAGLGEAD
jgi:hypothetical protein